VVKLDADVRDEFTWNTKQLFMFLSVEYATPANSNSQLVMWSKIILSKVCIVSLVCVLSVHKHLPHALHKESQGPAVSYLVCALTCMPRRRQRCQLDCGRWRLSAG